MSRLLLLISGAVLLGCAVFSFKYQSAILVLLLLLLPFLDRKWIVPKVICDRKIEAWLILLLVIITLIVITSDQYLYFFTMLFLVALPEEWFFRAYFMTRLDSVSNKPLLSNCVTSLLFGVMHLPTQGLLGMSVIFPSLILGWSYQKQQNILFVIVLHALFNLIYIVFLRDLLH